MLFMISISGCGPQFESAYIEGCIKIAEQSEERCACIGGILDDILTDERKIMMVNPGDLEFASGSMTRALVQSSIQVSDTCQRKAA